MQDMRKQRMHTTYLIAILFILLVSSQQLFSFFSSLMEGSEMSPAMVQIIYSVSAIVIFSFLYYMVKSSKYGRENFFFIPSSQEEHVLGRNKPRDAVFDSDKAVTFDFSSVGSGMCDQGCNDYGLIKGCPGRHHAYGQGSVNNFM